MIDVQPRESGYTKTTPIPLYWSVYGPSTPDRLLVLHGGPGAHHDYLLPQMLALANDRELVFYDQRGGGLSKTDDRTPITWRTQVEVLDRVFVELGLGTPTIVGYSWGGLLAMLFAIEAAAGRTQSRPSRLVLIDPAPAKREFSRTV
jgi:proline iminopeptidase